MWRWLEDEKTSLYNHCSHFHPVCLIFSHSLLEILDFDWSIFLHDVEKKQKKLDDISKKFGDEREKALNDALKLIEKDFGKGSIMRLGERAEQKVQVMSSGSLALDIALGAGGYPKGRIIEIYGPESSGKTTVALHAVAQAQKEGGIAAFYRCGACLGSILCSGSWSQYRRTSLVSTRLRGART